MKLGVPKSRKQLEEFRARLEENIKQNKKREQELKREIAQLEAKLAELKRELRRRQEDRRESQRELEKLKKRYYQFLYSRRRLVIDKPGKVLSKMFGEVP